MGGARHLPSSLLVPLFATLITLASGVVFTVGGVVVVVVAVAFRLAGVLVVAAMFTGASVTNRVYLYRGL